VLFHFGLAASAAIAALSAGMAGYHFLGRLSWLDSFLNAAMILGGMGPVNALNTPAAKVFAGMYALFSGVIFIGMAAVVTAPFAHRLLHRFHVDDESTDD
jgi:ABC-type glycerol-3-phosphate transport system permease component